MLGHWARRLASATRNPRWSAARPSRTAFAVLTPTQKGSIAEAVIAAEAVKAGVNVLRPMAEGGRYDLVFEINGRFVRVQCKSGSVAATSSSFDADCRHTPRGYVRTTYDASEVDAIAIYCPTTGLLSVPIETSRQREIRPTRPGENNQEFAITYAGRTRSRGYSSAGRARDWQSRGRRFEPG